MLNYHKYGIIEELPATGAAAAALVWKARRRKLARRRLRRARGTRAYPFQFVQVGYAAPRRAAFVGRRLRCKRPVRVYHFAAPFPLLVFKRFPRPKIKRKRINVLRFARKRYVIAPAPVSFVAYTSIARRRMKMKRRKMVTRWWLPQVIHVMSPASGSSGAAYIYCLHIGIGIGL